MDKEILKKLDKLSQEINELKNQINELKNRQDIYPINVPFVQNFDPCPNGGEHDYPFPWYSVIPPNCKKCGKQAEKLELTYSEYPTPKTGDAPEVWFYDINSRNLIHEDDYDFKGINLNEFNSKINSNE